MGDQRATIRTTTYGPNECEACGLTDNPDAPPYDEWEQRSKLEGKDFGLYYDRDGNPIDFAMWVWLSEAHPGYKIIRHTHGDNDSLISTVHLGINHNFSGTEPPIIFETMVFGIDGWEDYQERYQTETEATVGHEQVLAAINAGISASEQP